MKRIALLAVIGAGLVALPGTASAVEGCAYNGGQTDPVGVYTGGGVTGDALVGVCAQTDGTGGFYGGYVEVGAAAGKGRAIADVVPVPVGVYGVVDGDDRNTGQAAGYGALSNYENGTVDGCTLPADQDDNGSGTNSGGCLSIRSGPSSTNPVLVSLPVPLIACGNTSGPSFDSAGRDGCTLP